MKKRNRAYQKIENDYQEFKNTMLVQEPSAVFDRAYKIFCINEIYAALKDSYELTAEDISAILDFRGNILEQIYDEWLHDGYTHQDLFIDTISNTFSMLRQKTVGNLERLPDDSITISEMKKYGYCWDGMLPMRSTAAGKVMKHYPVYRLYSNNTESLAMSSKDIFCHAENGGIFGVEKDKLKTAI